jgi:uncharacterized membrane protein
MVFAFLTKVSQKLVFWVLLDVLIFLVFSLIALHYYPAQGQMEYQIDLSLKILSGQAPYVDFTSEYPPLALLSYLLPALLFRSQVAYYVAFVVELLIFDILAIILIARISPRFRISVTQSLSMHALVILAVGPIIVVTYDIIPAVLVLAALTFFVNGRTNLAWTFIGLGLMTKLYPIIIAPFFLFYHLRQMQYKQIAKGIMIFVIIVLALSLPWLLLNTRGYLTLFTYHLERGLHSESTYGSILLFGKILGLIKVEGIYNFGSWNLYSPLANQLATVSFVIMAGLLSIVYLLYARALLRVTSNPKTVFLQSEHAATLLQYVLAAIFIFILFGKVFSPQYMIWLCPLLPLVTGRWKIPLYTVFCVAGAFSQIVYPYYYQLFEGNSPPLVVMMVARNFLLLVAGVLLLLPRERRLTKESEYHLKCSTY